LPDGFARAAALTSRCIGGRFVYASNRQHGSIAIWSFDPTARDCSSSPRTAGAASITSRFHPGSERHDAAVANEAGGLLLAFAIEAAAPGLIGRTGAAAPTFSECCRIEAADRLNEQPGRDRDRQHAAQDPGQTIARKPAAEGAA